MLVVPKSIDKSAENKLNNGRRLLMEIRVTQSKRITPAGLIGQVGKAPVGSQVRFFAQLAKETGWRHITAPHCADHGLPLTRQQKKAAGPALITKCSSSCAVIQRGQADPVSKRNLIRQKKRGKLSSEEPLSRRHSLSVVFLCQGPGSAPLDPYVFFRRMHHRRWRCRVYRYRPQKRPISSAQRSR